MKFRKIVSIDYTGIDDFVHEKLKSLCDKLVIYNDFPKSEDEIIIRAKDADVILVSWNTPVTANIIKKLPSLKYIGMCCSLYDEKSSNVDIIQSKKQDIIVKGVKNYGDEGVVEYFYSELIRLFKGLGDVQFKDEQIELGGIKLGVIGLGTLGKMIADTGKFFSMDIYYHNRNRRDDVDYIYLPLDELLKTCDVITTHLPRNTIVMGEKEFSALGNGKVFVNTGLLPSFELHAFDKWIKTENNFAIFDADSITEEFIVKYKDYPNVIINKAVSGFTRNARKRLAHKVIANLEDVLKLI